MSDTPEYNPTDLDRAAVQVTLERIDEKHEALPTCALCGQHARVLDPAGTCSKTSQSHREFRAEALAMQSAGVR